MYDLQNMIASTSAQASDIFGSAEASRTVLTVTALNKIESFDSSAALDNTVAFCRPTAISASKRFKSVAVTLR